MPTNEDLLMRTREKLAEANDFIKAITTTPFTYGVVVNYNGGDSVDVAIGGKVVEIGYHQRIRSKLAPGIGVRIKDIPAGMSSIPCVMDIRPYNGIGVTTSIDEVLEDGRVVVEDGGKKYVLKICGNAEKGDRIIVDSGINVVMQNLGKKSKQYHVAEIPYVPWCAIGGLEETIETLKEAVEEPFIHSEIYERYGKHPPKGVLFYGPPGCGKTLLAKAVAYNLSERMREEGKSNGNGYFLSVKGPELKNMWYGESERGIRELFQRARENAKERDDITVLFLDEAESLLGKRGNRLGHIDDSLVTQFLAEMDGMEANSNVVLILATNRADIIDPAVLRSGRIDRRIRIGRPNKTACEQIFGIYLKDMPIAESKSIINNNSSSLSKYASCQIFSPLYPVFEARFNDGKLENICLGNLMSGAMVESICQRAAGLAIKREIKQGISGIEKDDLGIAIKQEYEEYRELVQIEREDLEACFQGRIDAITDVRRIKAHEIQEGAV